MLQANKPLEEYIPEFLHEIQGYKAIFSGQEPEITHAWNQAAIVMNDQFVITASENGVMRWERLLKITPNPSFTQEERKFTILSRLVEQLPFTMRRLERILSELCTPEGFSAELHPNEYILCVKVALTAVNNFNDVGLMLRRVCPANLKVLLTIEYNQHYKLRQLTHAEMGGKTHHQIRNEVI
ncbi:MAG: YmfQ family protein [Oscillospiraceae bacterium]|nr:YmfQ family protein [Oscillospiraceae bacterium]